MQKWCWKYNKILELEAWRNLYHLLCTVLKNRNVINCGIIGDKTYIFQFNPEIKCQNRQWKSKSEGP